LMVLDEVKEWDKAARIYDQWFRTKVGSYIFRIELSTLKKAFKRIGKKGRFLDVGCGTGLFTVPVSGDTCEVVGIDTSVNMAARAKKRGVNVIVGDAHHLPFKSKVFDTVMFFTTLEFLREEPALGEVHRIIRKRGVMVVGVHNLLNPWNVYRKIRARFKKKSFYKVIRYYSLWRLRNVLSSKGFYVRSVSSYIFLPCLIRLTFFGRVARIFERRIDYKHLGAILIAETITIK
jgi:ubiquinone/menaquinone biosynthesis C-methylase UbiE